MNMQSSAFENNGTIPRRFTCDGDDINPPMTIENPPDATKSFALVMDDPDAPAGRFIHWVVYDIPPDTRDISEDSVPGKQLTNSFGQTAYGGPCPPSGTHRYVIRLYALDVSHLEVGEEGESALSRAMAGHIIERAELIGVYGK